MTTCLMRCSNRVINLQYSKVHKTLINLVKLHAMSSPVPMSVLLNEEPAVMIDDDVVSKPSTSEDNKVGGVMDFVDDRDDDDDDNEPSSAAQRKHFFMKELRVLMYGFGGDREPYQETLELLEQMTVEYIQAMTAKCIQTGKPGKIALEDIWYLTRRDHRKFTRVKDLLNMSEELKKARKAFDENKFEAGNAASK